MTDAIEDYTKFWLQTEAPPNEETWKIMRVVFLQRILQLEDDLRYRTDRHVLMAQRIIDLAGKEDRESLGQVVREVWVTWAKSQPNPKPSWLIPWEQLPENFKEVDRLIGEKVALVLKLIHAKR